MNGVGQVLGFQCSNVLIGPLKAVIKTKMEKTDTMDITINKWQMGGSGFILSIGLTMYSKMT